MEIDTIFTQRPILNNKINKKAAETASPQDGRRLLCSCKAKPGCVFFSHSIPESEELSIEAAVVP